jgi:hypothetical protein
MHHSNIQCAVMCFVGVCDKLGLALLAAIRIVGTMLLRCVGLADWVALNDQQKEDFA